MPIAKALVEITITNHRWVFMAFGVVLGAAAVSAGITVGEAYNRSRV